jgi:hypothetical protein
MSTSRKSVEETETQQTLRQLFNGAAAMSLAVFDRLDAEPEMTRFLDAIKQHPEERAFVVNLFLNSFSDAFHMRAAPTDLLMFCMSELRWQEIRDFAEQQRNDDIKKHGVVCYHIWNHILESFVDGWRAKYFQDFTSQE